MQIFSTFEEANKNDRLLRSITDMSIELRNVNQKRTCVNYNIKNAVPMSLSLDFSVLSKGQLTNIPCTGLNQNCVNH